MSFGLKLFMTADAVGGVWTYALELARGLADHGVETTLAVVGPDPSPAQAAQARATPGLTLLSAGVPLDWAASSGAAVEAASRRLADLARATGAQVVQVNSAALAAAGSFGAPLVVACHSCVATWWAAVREGPLPDDFAWRTGLARRGFDRADALVAPTQAFARATAERYGLRRVPIVVRNGRRAPRAPGRMSAEDLVFTAGRLWDDGKNLAVLDRAAASLSAPVLAGGPLEGPNGERARFSHVEALGPLSAAAVSKTLARKPVFVSTALYEPFGLTALEAAQAGCALVLSDIETFRELWDGAAHFVDPRDPDAVARAAADLLADPARRAARGAAAKARARRYGAAAMVRAMLGVYRSLAPTPAGSETRARLDVPGGAAAA